MAAGLTTATLPASDSLEIYGDFRLRLEADWDSRRADGSERDDRNRARVRLRLGLDKKLDERFSLGARLRTGSDSSHQSPHITIVDFSGNDTGDADVNLDKWFLSYSQGSFSGWVGRNSHPFWKQNEMLLDDDATPAGFGFRIDRAAGERAEVRLAGGYFSLPVGLGEFAGNLGGLQLVYQRTGPGGSGWTVAGGVLSFASDATDPDAARLLNGNGFRDYLVYQVSGQLRSTARSRPLAFGLDLLHNAESYSATASDPYTAAHHDETDGWVASVRWGASAKPGDRQLRYDFGRVEALAVNSSYAQDDWVRWGSSTETRATDFEGHELRWTWVLDDGLNLVTRLYLVESISTAEDGNRLRVDLNYRF